MAKANFKNWLIFPAYLFLTGLIVNSVYLSDKYINFYYKGGFLSGDCGDDCDSVMTSKFAMLFGIPIPVYGLSFFILLAIAFIVTHATTNKKFDQSLPTPKIFFEVLLISACVAAAVFLYILYFDLKMICKFCLASHTLTYALTFYYFKFIRSYLK